MHFVNHKIHFFKRSVIAIEKILLFYAYSITGIVSKKTGLESRDQYPARLFQKTEKL